MSTEKLSELSKPVAWTDERGNLCTTRNKERGLESRYHQDYEKYTTPFYSQEYVSALEQKIAELEQAMRHIHGALLDITVPRVAIAKAAELAVERAVMKEQSNG